MLREIIGYVRFMKFEKTKNDITYRYFLITFFVQMKTSKWIVIYKTLDF